MSRAQPRHIAHVLAAALVIAHGAAAGVAAHGGVTVGPYEIEVGWRTEPAIVGQANAVVVAITDVETLQPATDLDASELSVTVAPAGKEGSEQMLTQARDVVSGASVPGSFEATFVPVEAGTYTFRVAGSIDGTAVDFTVDNFVDAPAAEPAPELDPLVVVGGGAILLLVAGMALLWFRVRPTPSAATTRGRVPSKRRVRRGRDT